MLCFAQLFQIHHQYSGDLRWTRIFYGIEDLFRSCGDKQYLKYWERKLLLSRKRFDQLTHTQYSVNVNVRVFGVWKASLLLSELQMKPIAPDSKWAHDSVGFITNDSIYIFVAIEFRVHFE